MKYVLVLVKNQYSKTPYDKWLEGTDIQPIILVSNSFEEEYKHFPLVFSFSNYEKNDSVKHKALELASELEVVGLFARAESDIIRAAELREILNLPGQNLQSALAFRNKIVMKNHLQGTEVLLPKYTVINSKESLKAFAEENKYPIVVKPLLESGSTGVTIISNENEIINFLSNHEGDLRDLEVEEFIDGQMFHIDGLVINNDIVFVQPYKYINDCLEYRNNNYLGGRTVSPYESDYSSLVDEVKKIIRALPSPKNMAFHAEIWKKKNGQFVFCEIASRTGGATIGLSLEYGFNINIDKIWFLIESGVLKTLPEPIKYNYPTGWLSIPPLNGTLLEMPLDTSSKSYIKISQYCGTAGERYYGGVKSGLFLAGYAIGGETEDDVEKNIIAAADWFSQNSKWQLT